MGLFEDHGDSFRTLGPPVVQNRQRGRRVLTIACVGLAIFAASTLFISGIWSQRLAWATTFDVADPQPDESTPAANAPNPVDILGTVDPYDSSQVLHGPPTLNFRGNLHADKKYITSWISAGWTNDVMTYINLVYLAMITERIPILPPFVPSHIGGLDTVPPILFSEVFDLPRLRSAVRSPIIEWSEVKNSSSRELDDLGCWNTWEAVQDREHYPRRSPIPSLLSLDISYTKAPSWIKLIPNFAHDYHTTFWSLAALAFPENRKENLVDPRESEINKLRLPPDEQLLCYDYLYYICAHQPFEYDFDFSPAWRFVGRHLYWSSKIDDLVDQYVRRTIGVADGEKTPTWIAVHLRHGDFRNVCGDVPLDQCFTPLDVVARRVDEVKQELYEKSGIAVNHVIITSDEKNSTWWADVEERGWLQVDHSETVAKYGPWYPVLIDAGIQSSGMGFIGTDRSTMSILARRRVQSWRDGAVRTVRWGRVGADDH